MNPFALRRDVKGQAMWADGTPDPVPLRLRVQPDGALQYEVRMTELKATYLAFDLDLAWGTSQADNDVAVLDILNAAMDLELTPEELGASRDDDGRVTMLDWHDNHPCEYVGSGHSSAGGAVGLGTAIRTGSTGAIV